jgi:hypothetical protein
MQWKDWYIRKVYGIFNRTSLHLIKSSLMLSLILAWFRFWVLENLTMVSSSLIMSLEFEEVLCLKSGVPG